MGAIILIFFLIKGKNLYIYMYLSLGQVKQVVLLMRLPRTLLLSRTLLLCKMLLLQKISK